MYSTPHIPGIFIIVTVFLCVYSFSLLKQCCTVYMLFINISLVNVLQMKTHTAHFANPLLDLYF